MARKVIRTQSSDGSWTETTEVKKGFVFYFGWVLITLFVIAIAWKDPWMWFIYGMLLFLAVLGGVAKRKKWFE